jgi:hypothetical protein
MVRFGSDLKSDLSGAKDLGISLRLNSAKNLFLGEIKHFRDSSSPEFTLSATKGLLRMTGSRPFSAFW